MKSANDNDELDADEARIEALHERLFQTINSFESNPEVFDAVAGYVKNKLGYTESPQTMRFERKEEMLKVTYAAINRLVERHDEILEMDDTFVELIKPFIDVEVLNHRGGPQLV